MDSIGIPPERVAVFQALFEGGSEMGALMRSLDWLQTRRRV